jgi:PII-like signaling protein
MLTTIDTKEQIVRLLFHLDEMVYEGLIAISDVEVIRYVHEESVWS